MSNKNRLQPYRQALYNFDPETVREVINNLFHPDALLQLCHPFETLPNPDALFDRALMPLFDAIPDLECRDTIVMEGPSRNQGQWVGCCGYYTGNFDHPWLDIPPTRRQVSLRFHEFFRFEDGRIVEMQAIWDIPEVMMQAGAWPMAPSLGREWHVPAPTPQNGLVPDPRDEARSSASLSLVERMLKSLGNYADGGAKAMRLDDYWHPRCSWYGPSGIGTGRGLRGFRNWHQIPFLNAMPNRDGNPDNGHLFADGDFVGFTGWPGMSMTISQDGWLGIAPNDQEITMRSLDFWRCENGLIRENWVLIDLLHVYHQLGVDVFHRLREFNKARGLQPFEE